MKFNVMSDLHLEFGPLREEPSGGDVLLLSGDIGLAQYFKSRLPWLEEVCDKYNTVCMVMGNHEHYNGDFDKSIGYIERVTEGIDNFHVLDNDIIELGDDVVLVGATLWSDIDIMHEEAIKWGMNDFRIISNFSTTKAIQQFNKSREYIEHVLNAYHGKKVVVMTHHAPSLEVPEIYRGNILNTAYGSNLEAMIEKYEPLYWLHGHTHVSRRYTIGTTEVLCNPRGYYGHEENPEFDINLTIEVLQK